MLWRELIYFRYYFSIQLEQIAPYWVLGVLLGSAISVLGKKSISNGFTALRTRQMGILGVIPASLLGIASPLCMYGTIPVAASFSEKGAPDDWLAAFIMCSILLNPQLLIYSAALGGRALIVRFAACFICGIVAGLSIRFFFRGRRFFDFSGFAEPENRDIDPDLSLRLLKNICRNIRATGGYFLLGTALSALFQRYVPPQVFASLFGGSKGFGILMAATVGVPLYMCGGGTIPLLAGWLQTGMSMGSAAAFMVTGPATKITNLGALKIVLGAKHFVLYLLFTAAFSFAAGLIVDCLL